MRNRGYLLLGAVAVSLSTLATTSLVSAQSATDATNNPAAAPNSPRANAAVPSLQASSKPAPPPPPGLVYSPVKVKVDGFFSWAILDRLSGEINGSKNLAATNSAESMIKIWIVSDFLRQSAQRNELPSARRLAQARAAIRDSDDVAAQSLYVAQGRDSVVSRMISMCGLSDTKIAGPRGLNDRGWWSYTRISARDAVRLGECVKSGTAAGPRWTSWVLDQMHKVRGTAAPEDQDATRGGGRWGIIDGLPEEVRAEGRIAIKNGWTLINADRMWHVNCLAIADQWALAVLMRYPGKLGLRYGARTCRAVAAQLVTHRRSSPGAAAR